jgi:hypothetical protein
MNWRYRAEPQAVARRGIHPTSTLFRAGWQVAQSETGSAQSRRSDPLGPRTAPLWPVSLLMRSLLVPYAPSALFFLCDLANLACLVAYVFLLVLVRFLTVPGTVERGAL